MDASMPQTPLQRGSFLQLCTRWIVSEPDPSATSTFSNATRTSPPGLASQGTPESVQSCFTDLETRHLLGRQCILCGTTRDVGVILANPFAVRCHVGLCRDCYT